MNTNKANRDVLHNWLGRELAEILHPVYRNAATFQLSLKSHFVKFLLLASGMLFLTNATTPLLILCAIAGLVGVYQSYTSLTVESRED